MISGPICDFCSSSDPPWLYPCRTFRITIGLPGERGESRDDWTACDECARLIEADDRKALSARALAAQVARHPLLPQPGVYGDARSLIDTLHRAFWEHRDGPRRRI